MKKLSNWLWSLAIVLLLILCLLQGVKVGSIQAVSEAVAEHELAILAHDRQIPYMAEYLMLVETISEAAKDKLTPIEIVNVAQVITEQCSLNESLGLTSDKILAIIERESGFNPDAVSYADAYGLMQVIQPTFLVHSPVLGYADFREEVALDPVMNVKIGIRELVRLRKYWLSHGVNSWLIVYTSYFWGERNAWDLLSSKKRARLPSLEYGQGITDLATKWRERGVG